VTPACARRTLAGQAWPKALVRALAFALLLPAMQPNTAWGATPVAADAEVRYLLDAVVASGCRFFRNGSWYAAAMARDHLLGKYSRLSAAGRIGSAEDFIELAATRSSLSGQAYAVQCAAAAPQASGGWFHRELLLHRSSGDAGRAKPTPR